MTSSSRHNVNDEIYIADQITKDDIPSFVKYLNNPTLFANTLRIPYPYTSADGEEFCELVKSSSRHSDHYFAIRLRSTDELIGGCSLHRSASNERQAEIGYWLGEPFWHRGLMPQIILKLIEVMIKDWTNLVRIEAHIFKWNSASMRVAEKAGFIFEGILRKYTHKNGQDIDVHLYTFIVE